MVVDDETLADLTASYPVLWRDGEAAPDRCYLGCPHLSGAQVEWWAAHICEALRSSGRETIAVPTTICVAPQTLTRLRSAGSAATTLEAAGVSLSAGCPMQLFDNELSDGSAVITNSTKLRTYTSARFFPDDRIVEIVVSGAL